MSQEVWVKRHSHRQREFYWEVCEVGIGGQDRRLRIIRNCKLLCQVCHHIIGGKYPQRTTLWLQNEANEVSYLKGEKRYLKLKKLEGSLVRRGVG